MAQPARYSATQIALHWAVVVLVVVQLLTGELMSDFFHELIRNTATPPRMGNAVWHIVSGMLILVIMLSRLILRLSRGVPPAKADSAGWDKVLSRLNHWIFYLVLIAMPVVGLIAYLVPSRTAADIHQATVPLLLALVALHVAGAFYHHFIRKDGLIWRMATPERGVERVPPARRR